MESRYRLTGKNHIVEQKQNVVGKQFLIACRTANPQWFKYARITKIIQSVPSKVTTGVVYEVGTNEIEEKKCEFCGTTITKDGYSFHSAECVDLREEGKKNNLTFY